jgi:trehalose utilization protein
VYLQFGDGPVTYGDDNFRRVLRNSIDWVASDAARDWVSSRNSSE